MDRIIPLIHLVGKRNTAMTVVSCNIKKQLASITRRISAIKHDSKRGQLLSLLHYIDILANTEKPGIYYVIELSNGRVVSGHISCIPKKDTYSFGDRIDIQLLMEELGIVSNGILDNIPEMVYYNQEITENLNNISSIYLYKDTHGQWGMDKKCQFHLPVAWFQSGIIVHIVNARPHLQGVYALGIPHKYLKNED